MESNRSGMTHCLTAISLPSPESAYSTGKRSVFLLLIFFFLKIHVTKNIVTLLRSNFQARINIVRGDAVILQQVS